MKRWVLLLGWALTAASAQDTRQPGSAFMSAPLQALQRDATQHPGQLFVAEGEALWARPGDNGRRCADCHATPMPVAARYPVHDGTTGRPLSLPARVDRCRQQHLAQPPQGPDGPAVLALTALLTERSRGQPVTPDPRLQAWAARGEQLWQQRFGQLNLSCAQCHDQRAGQRLGGATIPQAHATGYPIYRLEWQGAGSLQRRLRGCLTGVRAEPFAPAADEWAALEAWLTQRAAGMVWEGMGLRP